MEDKAQISQKPPKATFRALEIRLEIRLEISQQRGGREEVPGPEENDEEALHKQVQD